MQSESDLMFYNTLLNFHNNMARFASSSSDKTIRVWDLGMRDSVHTFDGHDDQVWGISFNEDGSRLASCGDDGMIQIYSCDI